MLSNSIPEASTVLLLSSSATYLIAFTCYPGSKICSRFTSSSGCYLAGRGEKRLQRRSGQTDGLQRKTECEDAWRDELLDKLRYNTHITSFCPTIQIYQKQSFSKSIILVHFRFHWRSVKKKKKSNLNHNGCSPKRSQLHRLVQWHKVYSIWEQIGHAQ